MTETSALQVPQNPVILRCHRIMEAFAKSDDERDFYLDRLEGFLVYVDLDKSQEELDELEAELESNKERYVPIPKLTFYEVKKLMEGFVNEKVYDIDTKEKLLDIISSKEARENFLEFIYDHHSELEKWQQYYQERFRVRIIEWLRNNAFDFVFEEDIELTKSIVERVKINMFTAKVSKDIVQARKILAAKAATYYSNEALNPRPKRGRPPKQVAKVETEPQFSQDIYVAVPRASKPFLFTPDYHSSSMIFTFSGKFASEADLLAHRRQQLQSTTDFVTIGQKLQAIRTISSTFKDPSSTPRFGGEEALMPLPKAPVKGSLKKGDLDAPRRPVSFDDDDKSSFDKKELSSKKSSKASSLKKAEKESDAKKKASAKAKSTGSQSLKEKTTSKKAKETKEAKTSAKSSKATVGGIGSQKPNSKQKIRLRPLVRKIKKTS